SRVHGLVPSRRARSRSFRQCFSLGAQRSVGFPSTRTPRKRKCPFPALVPHLRGRSKTAAAMFFRSRAAAKAGFRGESLWTRAADTVISVTSRRARCLRDVTVPSTT
ncbi:unnamed protein product, partial [Ixodes pacificus]